jgi:hypothetical protein
MGKTPNQCQYGSCTEKHTTTYLDKARKLWRLCEEHRNIVKRRKA